MQSTVETASEANITPRDRKLMAVAPYEKAAIPEPTSGTSSTITAGKHRHDPIDSDARYLYSFYPEARRSVMASPLARKRWLLRCGQGRPHDGMAIMDADQ